jgi:hypothetical protein
MEVKDLGQLVTTRAVSYLQEINKEFYIFIIKCLTKYLKHDWGDLEKEDKQMNDDAVKSGERILASYKFPDNAPWTDDALNMYGGKEDRIWIITEWDRSVTTILFPGEY